MPSTPSANIKRTLKDYVTVFVSYDEPKADERFERVQIFLPKIGHVHGIDGILNAYQAAAAMAEGEDYVITIDGDTDVMPELFHLPAQRIEELERPVWSWPARNSVNGLVYGNGGVKLWHIPSLQSLTSIKATTVTDSIGGAASATAAYANTHCHDSPAHAFRAGYREGARLAGKINQDPGGMTRYRLTVWCSVGADMPNGEYCMLGARLGALDYTKHRLPERGFNDLRHINTVFERIERDSADLSVQMAALHSPVEAAFALKFTALDADGSRFFKQNAQPPISAGMIDRAASHLRATAQPGDKLIAMDLFRVAASLGSSNAFHNMARMFHMGELGERNLAEAYIYYCEAERRGNAFAPFHLGQMYLWGQGVAKDPKRARELFQLSLSRGFEQARLALVELDED